MSLQSIIIIAVIGAFFLIFYIVYQVRRGRAAFKKVDPSKLKDWDKDGWDDDR